MTSPWGMLTDLPVGAKALHRCRVRFDDRETWHVSLFPFFDANGEIKSLLFVRYDSATLHSVAFHPGVFEQPHPWATKRIRLPAGEVRALQPGHALERLVQLWHYDPWWVLAEPPFQRHSATPTLKRTNAVNRLPPKTASLAFDRSLTHVRSIQVHKDGDLETILWHSTWLRKSEAYEERAGFTRSRWVLAPFWSDRCGVSSLRFSKRR